MSGIKKETLEKFADNIIDELNKKYNQNNEYDFEKQYVTKINTEILQITMHKKGDCLCPSIHVEQLVALSPEAAADEIFSIFQDSMQQRTDAKQIVKDIMNNFDSLLGNILPRLINITTNQELIKTTPYREIADDLGIIYGIDTNDFWITITDNMLKNVNKSIDEIHDAAIKNIMSSNRFKSMEIADILMNMPQALPIITLLRSQGATDQQIKHYLFSNGGPNLYVVGRFDDHDRNMNYGAIAILRADILNNIMQKENCNSLIIIPSSIHEIIAAPCHVQKDKNGNITNSQDLQTITMMIQEVNASDLKPADTLSDHPYIFDGKTLMSVN